MKYPSFVIGVLLSSVAGQNKAPEITHMYSLGDSVSDTGGYQELSGGEGLDKKLYSKGKFTDDKTWVEYLKDQFSLEDFKNYAVGKATSDSNLVSATVLTNNREVPGCIQQASSLKSDLEGKRSTKGQTLVTLAFFGNDFLSDKAPSFEDYFKRISQCVIDVIETNKVGHIIMPTTSGAEYFPYFNDKSMLKKGITQIGVRVKDSWGQLLGGLKSKYPDTVIHELDHEKIIANLVENNKNGNSACINTTPFEKNDDIKLCNNPASLVFYDQLHPSSAAHKAMAADAYHLLESKSKSESESKPDTEAEADSYHDKDSDRKRTPEVIREKQPTKDDDTSEESSYKKGPSGSRDPSKESPKQPTKDDATLSGESLSKKGSSSSNDPSEKSLEQPEPRLHQKPSQKLDQNQTRTPPRREPNRQNGSNFSRHRPQNPYRSPHANSYYSYYPYYPYYPNYQNYHHGYIHHQRPERIPSDAPKVYDPTTGQYIRYYYNPHTGEHRSY